MNAEATAEWKTLPRIAQIYSVYLLGLLIFYLALPAISYLIFWGALPKIGLSMIYGFLLAPAISLRFLLLLTGQLPIRSSPLALGFFLLLGISVLQFIWFPTISAQLGTESFLSTLTFTFVGSWLVCLGAASDLCSAEHRGGFSCPGLLWGGGPTAPG